ncbi:hypothetical protein [Streptomyces sp. NPDC058412]|uniref:hypothetical protein n=1 Tax=Streptomyces sp. NPDC058412 TaxID=3346486 RepID=UPI0036522534
MPDLAEGQVAVVFLLIAGGVSGVGCEGKLQVGAQDVDAGLTETVVRGIVGQAGQGVHATELDGGGVRAELVAGLGEPLGMAGGIAVRTGLVDTLAAVRDDQGDERASPGDHSEGEFHQVEEGLGVEFRGGVDLLEVQ